ncbi:MAG: glycosyltransferase family 4 protein [Pseudomonadota bacterium]
MKDHAPVAFYAPMKSPDHPTPSGDREIARLTLQALQAAGFAPFVASHLRLYDGEGSADAQRALMAQADSAAENLIETMRPAPPCLWYTYHCYFKAPDLIGPKVTAALGIPYVVAEPSLSPRRLVGPWECFAAASEAAILGADTLLWSTERDRPALEAAGALGRMTELPPFIDVGPAPIPPVRRGWLNLLTVAMMREGEKLESYRRLAEALHLIDEPWRLTIVGDGPARPAIRSMMDAFGKKVSFWGRIESRDALRRIYEAADVFVWPGVGEGVGMVYLEAQAAGLPALAEDHTAPRSVTAETPARPLDPADFARRIVEIARDDDARARARDHVETHHSIARAAATLSEHLGVLIR